MDGMNEEDCNLYKSLFNNINNQVMCLRSTRYPP